jgi:YD repeat-containing protein
MLICVLIHKKTLMKMLIFLMLGLLCTTRVEASGVTNIYDNSERLVQTRTSDQDVEYLYDENGNLLQKRSTENLILNPSFAYSTLGWILGSSLMFVQEDIKKEGFHSLQFHSNTQTSTGAQSEIIKVTPSTMYTLSGWIRDSLSSGDVYIDWIELDAADQMIVDGGGIFASAKNEWQRGLVEFTTNASTVKLVVRMIVERNGVGSAFIDGIELVKGSVSRVLQGSFELGEASWNYDPTKIQIQGGTTKVGQRSLQFHSATPANSGADSGVAQVTPNTTYTLSGWIRDSLSSGDVYIDWLELDAANQIVVDGDGIFASAKNEWQRGQVEFTTNASTVKLVVRMIVEGNGVGSAFIDGIELVKGSVSRVLQGSFELGEASWNYDPTKIQIQGIQPK